MSSLNRAGPRALAALSSNDVTALLATAHMLHRAAQSGTTQPLLRGKNLGLLCQPDAAGKEDAIFFVRAAVELGAQVAQIRPSWSQQGGRDAFEDTARVLGRLYNAVECEGLPAALVHRLQLHSDVPVYDALASATHPTAQLAGLLDESIAPSDKRRFVLQAVLLCTLA